MIKSYLILGFTEDCDNTIMSLVKNVGGNLTSEQSKFLYDHTYSKDNFLGVKLGEWSDCSGHIDVRPDTLNYLQRTFIEDIKRLFHMNISHKRFEVIGITENVQKA